MDEPRRSAARTSRYLIPLGLGVLLIAWVWPEQDSSGPGPLTVYYSRLLGIRFEGQGYEARSIAGSVISHLYWLVLVVAAARATTATGRVLVFGAAALAGLVEILFAVAALVYDDFFGVGYVFGAVGGVLLIAGAVAGLGHRDAPEIRESEGAAT